MGQGERFRELCRGNSMLVTLTPAIVGRLNFHFRSTSIHISMSAHEEAAAAREMWGVPRGVDLSRCLLLLLLLLATLFMSSAGGSALDSTSSSFAEEIHQLAHLTHLVFPNGGSRHLLQASSTNATNATHAPLLLARNRTDRPNPLDGLRKYAGGYNLSSRDYGASVGFTGLPAWVLAIFWAALALILQLTFSCVGCCCPHSTKHEHRHERLGYVVAFLALILFTLAAIAGSILLYYAQRDFDAELASTLNYVVAESQTAEAGLREVQSNLTNVANLNIVGITFPQSDRDTIARLSSRLNKTANDLHDETWDNRNKVKHAINVGRIVVVVVASVMLAIVLGGPLFLAVEVRWLVYLLVLVGWGLAILTWVLCGIFIFLDNGIGDTCLAMQEWVASPTGNTSLDEFLPCNGAAAATALPVSKGYTDQIVADVNLGLSTRVNQNFEGGYNQSGPLVPTLCNTPPCPSNTTTLAEAPSAWTAYLCTPDSAGQVCTTQGRLTPDLYIGLVSAAKAADSLSTSGTFLANAANCTFVRDVFVDIHRYRCPSLRKHSQWIWIGLILVSAGSMFSILLWIVFVRRRKPRYGPKRQQTSLPKGQSQPFSAPPPPASSAA